VTENFAVNFSLNIEQLRKKFKSASIQEHFSKKNLKNEMAQMQSFEEFARSILQFKDQSKIAIILNELKDSFYEFNEINFCTRTLNIIKILLKIGETYTANHILQHITEASEKHIKEEVAEMLQLCFIKSNDLVKAEELNRSLSLNFRETPVTLLNRARLAFKSKDLTQAQSLLTIFFDQYGTSAEALIIQAGCFRAFNKTPEALTAVYHAIELDPVNTDAWVNLALISYSLGKKSEALVFLETALTINPNQTKVQQLIFSYYEELGLLERAIALCEKILDTCAIEAFTLTKLGQYQAKLNKFDDAIITLTKSLFYQPGQFDATVTLALCYYKLADYDRALTQFQNALEIDPNHELSHYSIGEVYRQQNQFFKAIKYYHKAIQLNSKFNEAIKALAHIYKVIGDKKQAMHFINNSIKNYPNEASSHYLKSTISPSEFTKYEISQLNNIIHSQSTSKIDKIFAAFSLFSSYNSKQEFDSAFSYLVLGNKLKMEVIDYNIIEDDWLFEKAKTANHLLNRSKFAYQIIKNNTPIFIVGMPRSGTSLLEQILTSHPKVNGAGEVPSMLASAIDYFEQLDSGYTALPPNASNNYLLELAKIAGENKYVTDKLPFNFFSIPIIRSYFPNAKIVHIYRDARATCWSNFTQLFNTTKITNYSYNLDNTLRFYENYASLMSILYKDHGEIIYSINYENLVDNPKFELIKLLDFLDLSWSDKCLEPENNTRAVLTASSQQVRSKIYKGSSHQWKSYQHLIKGMCPRFQHAERFNDFFN